MKRRFSHPSLGGLGGSALVIEKKGKEGKVAGKTTDIPTRNVRRGQNGQKSGKITIATLIWIERKRNASYHLIKGSFRREGNFEMADS